MKPEEGQFVDKPSGYILDEHGNEVAHTLQCPHCNSHFIPAASIVSTNRLRGWCQSCKRRTCGRQPCEICIPFKAKLDLVDGGNISESAQLKTYRKYQTELEKFQRKFNTPIL